MKAFSPLLRLSQVMAVAVFFLGGHAWGQTLITQTQTFTNASPGNIPYTFSAFNTSLGTLTGVTIELSSITTTGSTTVYNTSNLPPPFGSGTAGYSEDLTGGFSNTFIATSSTSASDKVTVVVTSNTQTQLGVAAGGNFTTGTLNGTQTPSPTDFSAADLANYLSSAGSTVTITLNASTSQNVSANAGTNTAYVAGNASAVASGNVTLIYTYTPVPEPSKTTACMIGLGLCLLVGRNYFKRNGFRLA